MAKTGNGVIGVMTRPGDTSSMNSPLRRSVKLARTTTTIDRRRASREEAYFMSEDFYRDADSHRDGDQ